MFSEFCREVAKVVLQFFNGFFINAVTDGIALNVSFYQSRVFEFFQVLRNCGLRKGQLVYNVAADTAIHFK